MRLLSVVGLFALVASIACNSVTSPVPTQAPQAAVAQESNEYGGVSKSDPANPNCLITSITPYQGNPQLVRLSGGHAYKSGTGPYLSWFRLNTSATWSSDDQNPWTYVTTWQSNPPGWAVIAFYEVKSIRTGELVCSASVYVGTTF
jgi:hypothetical protein